jgi:subtilisin family serine protease
MKNFLSFFFNEILSSQTEVISVGAHLIDTEDIVSSYIVFLEPLNASQDTLEKRAQVLLQQIGVNDKPLKVFNEIGGFVTNITDAQAQELVKIVGVKSVDQDREILLEEPIFNLQELNKSNNSYDNETTTNGEIIPWGVRAVWQGENITQRGNFASDSYAFVIDSGVLNTTGDLNLATNSSWHRSWVSGETPFTDGNGHGTHVAGTIGALVNGKGVVGVAPGSQIVSLKVFNSTGGGASHSTIIEAINHAVSVINSNNLSKDKVVINMSLSGVLNISIETAIKNAADQGIRFVVAAGNNGKDADGYSPASAGDHPNVFTVSAVDSSYRMPFWSNWDRLDSNDDIDDVDFAAPGVGVLSYYRNGQLAYLSGTSMAAPHVAGLLLTGGVQSGNYVTPNYSGTSDQFAITATRTFVPSETLSVPQQPYTPPSPTYTLNSVTSINEGQTLNVDVSTTNVNVGAYVHWEISGTGINMNDFNALSNLWGASLVGSDGKAIIRFDVKNDNITEGNEVIKLVLFDGAHQSLRKQVGEAFITIQDTSKTPVITTPQSLWGTVGSDIITGGAGPDRITGVLSSGTDAVSMGLGQIDIVSGGLGSDVFILGDSRGVFYDDRIIGNHGTSDYMLIKDFKRGEDKLQLKNGNSYLFESLNGDLFFYLNRNRNRSIETTGVNRDELIAVLEGVTTLGNSDFIVV